MMQNNILEQLQAAQKVTEAMIQDAHMIALIEQVSKACIAAYQKGGRILAAGNGGSAADAQHIVAELVVRFYTNRAALAAEALTANISTLTAIGNDFGYDQIFSRQIEANARPSDIFFALSTSGNSINIVKAAEQARSMGVLVVGFTGKNGGKLASLCDYCFKIPSDDTPRIQQAHMIIAHIICELIEKETLNR